MKKFALLASLTALVAFAAPAAASASPVWGPVGTVSSLDLPSAGSRVYYNMPSGLAWECTNHHLGLSVRKPASSIVDVTSATFSGCTAAPSWPNCTVTQTATSLPWTMEAVALTDVRLKVGGVKAKFTTTPGSLYSCSFAGLEFSFSGTLEGGSWNSSTHAVTYNTAGKLTSPTFPGAPIVETATLKNGAGTLTLF